MGEVIGHGPLRGLMQVMTACFGGKRSLLCRTRGAPIAGRAGRLAGSFPGCWRLLLRSDLIAAVPSWRLDLRNWPCGRPPIWGLVLVAALAAASIVAAPSQPAAASDAAPASDAAAGAGPSVQVNGGDLVDVATGRRLWSVHPYIARPMGSITKVMTALVVLKAGGLNREIRVTSDAVRYVRSTGASSAGLI